MDTTEHKETAQQSFCFPLKNLENDLLLLAVFDPSIHLAPFFAAQLPHPSLFTYIPFGPYPTPSSFFTTFYNPRVLNAANHGACLFAIFDKATEKMAGVVGYLNSSPENLRTEIGFIVILPEFQRSHVSSNAIGLLLHYALDLPERGGLGLRRVQWQSNADNEASIRAAERMGFKREGVRRWERLVMPGKTWPGKEEGDTARLRSGDPRAESPGRHSMVMGVCWDDWEMGGAREKADKNMARRS
ncbi:acyl-CoA N-acyltransferase [Pterulicium gracile]|uniref:Acyl-CoA N-acyltransferase n=1 Tax=Pterulicium gracile TaxID=1884261 RepID=A0A5C3Q787_9AGAR|nr:acyl-CoA N-acyltransferase [Pterula gracilis]